MRKVRKIYSQDIDVDNWFLTFITEFWKSNCYERNNFFRKKVGKVMYYYSVKLESLIV